MTTSKLATNERIKLRASFFNTVGAGLLLAGFLIPYLTIAQHAGSIVDRLTSGVPLTFGEEANMIAVAFAFTLALTGAKRMRREARDNHALRGRPARKFDLPAPLFLIRSRAMIGA